MLRSGYQTYDSELVPQVVQCFDQQTVCRKSNTMKWCRCAGSVWEYWFAAKDMWLKGETSDAKQSAFVWSLGNE